MLEPVKHLLQGRRVILASSSPRRREILSKAGLPDGFQVQPPMCDENLDPKLYAQQPGKYAEELAARKARDVMASVQDSSALVIGSDTVVTFDGAIFGKPRDVADAVSMLSQLSGRSHDVFTGVCLIGMSREQIFSERTRVHFSDLSKDVIDGYVASGEPMDKAGSYGIQALGGTLVEGIEGDYFNVVGFPLNKFCRELKTFLTLT